MLLLTIPRISRAIVGLAALAAVYQAALAEPSAEGKAAGQAVIPYIFSTITGKEAADNVPGYTSNPPERGLYGQSDLTGQAEALITACLATPDDPNCQAILGARNSANTPRDRISPNAPSVLEARRIAENPAATLEDISSFYGGCEVSLVDMPTTETRLCREYLNPTRPDECAPLASSGCTLEVSECRQADSETHACLVMEHRYSCPIPPSQSATVSNCPTNVFCFDGQCYNTAYTNDTDFARSMTFLEAAREAGIYLDTDTMRVFNGEASRCRRRLLKNCCYTDSAGKGMSNSSFMEQASSLVFDALTNSMGSTGIYNSLASLFNLLGVSDTFTYYSVTVIANGALAPAGMMVYFSDGRMTIQGDPFTLAMAVYIRSALDISECNKEETLLAMREGAELCRTVGTYCSSCIRVLGHCVTCIEHRTGKCCFNSKLARLINEQGRTQIGKGWGSGRRPDCSGFTIEQLERLDFSRMDLTQFYSSIVPKLPDASAIQNSNRERVSNCYYGEGKCN